MSSYYIRTISRPQGMRANELITSASNCYGKMKTFNHLGSLFTNENSIHEKENIDLKQEIHVISSNTFVLTPP